MDLYVCVKLTNFKLRAEIQIFVLENWYKTVHITHKMETIVMFAR